MVAAWTSLNGDNIGGALRSTDNGASWFNSSPGLPVFLRDPRLCGSPADPQILFMSAWLSFQSGGLFRTTDGGATWASTGWTGNQTVGDVACHPVDDQLLFVTQLSGGDAVLRSLDGGATFAPFSSGLENVVAPRELAFAGPSRLLLASAKGSYGTDLVTPTPTPTPTVTPSATPTPTASPTPTAARRPERFQRQDPGQLQGLVLARQGSKRPAHGSAQQYEAVSQNPISHVRFSWYLGNDTHDSECIRWKPPGTQSARHGGSEFIKSAMGVAKSTTAG